MAADFSITGEVKLNSDPAQSSVSKWTVAAGQLIADFAKRAASSLKDVAKSGLDYNAQMESYLTNFKVMLGNEQLAAEKLEEIRRMAASTPFSLSDLTDGTQTLLQFGIAADDTTGVLKRLGDISLGNADKLQTLVRAYGKMSSAQKVTLENVNMMIDAGFNPLNQMCDATGESMSDLYKRISEGKVSFSELEAAVAAATDEGGQFYNGMLEASQTFNGRMSTLTDNTKALLGSLVDSFYSSLSSLLPMANDAVLALSDALSEGGVPAMLDTAAELLDSFADGLIQKIPDVLTAGIQLAEELSSFLLSTGTDLLRSLSTGFASGIPDFLAEALPAVLSFTDKLRDNFGDFVSVGVDLVLSLANGLVNGLPQLFAYIPDIVINIAGLISDNAPKILAGAIGLMITLGKGLLQSLPLIVQNTGKIVEAIAAVISAFNWLNLGANILKGFANGIKSMASAVTQAMKQGVSGAITWIKSLPSQALQWGKNVIQSFINGITSKSAAAMATTAGMTIAKTAALPDAKEVGWSLSDDVVDKAEVNAFRIQNLAKQTEATTAKSAATTASTASTAASSASKSTKKATEEIVKSVSDTVTTLKDGVTTTTETVTETLKNGTTQQKQIITSTSREMVNGVLKDIKTVETIAADGKRTVSQTMESVRDVVSTITDTSTAIVDGVETTTQTVTEILADGTEQQKQVITATGTELIDGVQRTVKTVTNIAADGTQTVAKTIEDAGPQFASAGELVTTQLRTSLEDTWKDINKSIQTNVIGSISTLAKAIKNGDIASLGKWTAAIFWNACTNEQKTQINGFAMDALNRLGTALSGVGKHLVTLATNLVAQFVPAAGAATTAQELLNAVMDMNPILLVVSLIGLLTGALASFVSANKSTASSTKSVWNGVGDFMSWIFEQLLNAIGIGISGFIGMMNTLIAAYNAVAWLWGGTVSYIKNPAFEYAKKLRQDRADRKAEEQAQAAAEKAQSELDTKYAKASGAAEKKQLEAQYRKKQAELEKAKLTEDDPRMLAAEKAVAQADYEKLLTDLDKKLLDAQYKKDSAELSRRSTKDAAKLADLEKQIAEAENTIKTDKLERELLELELKKKLQELDAKYSPSDTGTSPSPTPTPTPEPDPVPEPTPLPDTTPDPEPEEPKLPTPDQTPAPTPDDSAIKDNTSALLEVNKKLTEMVKSANALVLSDNMAISSRVAASGTAQIAAAANNYHREGDTTIIQNINSKAQTAADLARETRWEADKSKARKR